MYKETKVKAGEIIWANYNKEFLRFYDKHRFLCDEISGMKKRVYTNERGEQVEEVVSKNNFLKGIQKLSSFIIDNIHYIKVEKNKQDILKRVEALENNYLNDLIYQKLSEKGNNLSVGDKIIFSGLYFHYLIEVFELSFYMSILLQDSMMISTSEVKKTVKYHMAEGFFDNLSKYRDKISDDISRFNILTVDNHLKIMFGYVYTYKFMLSETEIILIDKLMSLCLSLVLSKELITQINYAMTSDCLKLNKKLDLAKKGLPIKKALMKAYELINTSLSDANILPKINKEVFVDRSLI